MKPGELWHCYSLLILWFDQFKKKTLKVRAVSPCLATINSWMLSVANRIDSALHIGFSIFRIGILVIKLLGILLTPFSIPGLEKKTPLF